MAYQTRAQVLAENEVLKKQIADSQVIADYQVLTALAAGADERKAEIVFLKVELETAKRAAVAAETKLANCQVQLMQATGRISQLTHALTALYDGGGWSCEELSIPQQTALWEQAKRALLR